MNNQRKSSFYLNNLPLSDDDVDVELEGDGNNVQAEWEDDDSSPTITFNLNNLPSSADDINADDERDGEPVHLQWEGGDSTPTIIRSPSRGNLAIDLNDHPHDFDAPSLEVTAQSAPHLSQEDEDLDEDDFEASNSGMYHQQHIAPRRNKVSSNEDRWAIYTALLARSVNGKLKRDTTKEVSAMFSMSLRTVQRIWKQAKETPQGVLVDVSHRRTKKCGRKKIHIGIDQVKAVPLKHRTTLKSTALSLGVSTSTLCLRVKDGVLRRHSNAIKPLLREENKLARVKFCLSMLDPNSIHQEPTFVDMYNVVHIDEKWFYMTKKSETFYLHHDEEEPLRTCQSKNFIGKVMFLVAMARPRFDETGNEVFDGKIGVFPFVTTQVAQRRSRNRKAGTLEMKPMTAVTKDIIKACLIEKVIPAIQAKWPVEDSRKTIFIQQDNARTHVSASDEEFRVAATKNGFDIRIVCQPPNSPDLNVLDLGFFRAIQSLQHKECPRTIEELVNAVKKSYDDYPTTMINRVFLTLQTCMIQIMKIGGSNKYHIPHVRKETLDREGRLPKQFTCDYSIVHDAMNMLA